MLSRLFNNEYDRVANEVAKEVVNNALVVSGKKKENREHMGWIDGAEQCSSKTNSTICCRHDRSEVQPDS